MTVEIGQTAPDFTLTANNGEEVSLSDFRGKNVILYFYPKDMTPGCTTEACDFRDHHEEFQELDTVILGVSPDPLDRHKKFIDKYGLPFLLLADVDHEVAEMFGVWKSKNMFGKEFMGNERSTFVISKEGTLLKEWRKVKVKEHVAESLDYIKEHSA